MDSDLVVVCSGSARLSSAAARPGRAGRHNGETHLAERRTAAARQLVDAAALLRLAGAVLVEQHDEWEASTRRYLSEGSMRQLEALNEPLTSVDADALTGVIPVPELTAA